MPARPLSRREMLWKSGGGIAGLALTYLLGNDGLLAATPVTAGRAAAPGTSLGAALPGAAPSPLLPKTPHFPPKAKSVINLFMMGGCSHVDTFDYKGELQKRNGEPCPGLDVNELFNKQAGALMRSPFEFKPHGQTGKMVSSLFANVGESADDIAFIHSMHSKTNNHAPACYEMNTGMFRVGYPCLGAWAAYGLGTVNQDLPAFVVMLDHLGGPYGGSRNWGAGFMPAVYQGTSFRGGGPPVLDLSTPPGVSEERQRASLDFLEEINQKDEESHPGESDLAARIHSYELAYRMQSSAPDAVDLSKESNETKQMYGMDDPVSEPFGRRCLLARRLIERGVRFVQLYSGSGINGFVNSWDAHENLVVNHTTHAHEVDKPIRGLLTDLKRRGLMDETLVLFNMEFGRMPISQSAIGRDHNPLGYTVWMAGAGVKRGVSVGSTDEFGYRAQQEPHTVNDLHATVLHLLGIDHKRLTYRHMGRDIRLTDVAGELIEGVLA